MDGRKYHKVLNVQKLNLHTKLTQVTFQECNPDVTGTLLYSRPQMLQTCIMYSWLSRKNDRS